VSSDCFRVSHRAGMVRIALRGAEVTTRLPPSTSFPLIEGFFLGLSFVSTFHVVVDHQRRVLLICI
jgi:hypothetical protein